MKNYIFKWDNAILILFFFVIVNQTNAQASDAKFQGVMVYHFTQQITWPANDRNFIIGVLGKTPLSDVLQEIAKKRNVKGKRILIRNYSSVDQVNSCNILFLTKGEKGNLLKVINKVKSDKTLIITENPGGAKQGAGINFIKKDGKIKFEINKSSISNSGLKLSPTLEKLAVRII